MLRADGAPAARRRTAETRGPEAAGQAVDQGPAKDRAADPRNGDDSAKLILVEIRDVLLGQHPGLPGERVGLLRVGQRGFGIVLRVPDRLLEVPLRLRQPGPSASSDAAAPGRDEVRGRGHRTASNQHRLVQHRPRSLAPGLILTATRERAIQRRVCLLDVAQRAERIERPGGPPGPHISGDCLCLGHEGRQLARRSAARHRRGLVDLGIDLTQGGCQPRGCLSQLGFHVLDPVEQIGGLVRGRLGGLEQDRGPSWHSGRQVIPGASEAAVSEVESFERIAGVGGNHRDSFGCVLRTEAVEYLPGRGDPRRLLGDVRLDLGGQLRCSGRQVLQAIERIGLLIEQAVCLRAVHADVGQVPARRRVAHRDVVVEALPEREGGG